MRYLMVRQKGRRGKLKFKVDHRPITIGRAGDNRLRLLDTDVSRHHAEISQIDDATQIRDLDSRNGVLVNNDLIKAVSLRHGDVVRIGPYTLTFVDSPSDSDDDVGYETAIDEPVRDQPGSTPAGQGLALVDPMEQWEEEFGPDLFEPSPDFDEGPDLSLDPPSSDLQPAGLHLGIDETEPPPSDGPVVTDQASEPTDELRAARSQVEELESRLAAADTRLEEALARADSLEHQLTEEAEAKQLAADELDRNRRSLAELEDRCLQAEQQLAETRRENLDLDEQLRQTAQEKDLALAEELQALQNRHETRQQESESRIADLVQRLEEAAQSRSELLAAADESGDLLERKEAELMALGERAALAEATLEDSEAARKSLESRLAAEQDAMQAAQLQAAEIGDQQQEWQVRAASLTERIGRDEARIAELEKTNRDLEQKCASERESRERAEASLQDLEAVRKQLREEVDSLRTSLADSAGQVTALEVERENLQRQCDAERERADQADQASAGLQERDQARVEEIARLGDLLGQTETAKEAAEAGQREAEASARELDAKITQLREAQARAESEAAEAKAERDRLAEELEILGAARNSRADEDRKHAEELAEARRRVEEVQENAEADRAELMELKEQMASIEAVKNAAQGDAQMLHGRLVRALEEAEQREKRLKDVEAARADAEERLAQLTKRRGPRQP